MNILRIFTKICSFLSRVHLGRVKKECANTNIKHRVFRSTLTIEKRLPSSNSEIRDSNPGQETERKGGTRK